MSDPAWTKPDWTTMSAAAIRERLRFVTRPEACQLPELPDEVLRRDLPWLLARVEELEAQRRWSTADARLQKLREVQSEKEQLRTRLAEVEARLATVPGEAVCMHTGYRIEACSEQHQHRIAWRIGGVEHVKPSSDT